MQDTERLFDLHRHVLDPKQDEGDNGSDERREPPSCRPEEQRGYDDVQDAGP